jgi:5-methyltetrahydrofolate--homocysteine methyltransferase
MPCIMPVADAHEHDGRPACTPAVPAVTAIIPGMERRRRPDRSSRPTADAAAAPAPIDVDPAAFPDAATRRAIDGGAASARFRALLDEGGPILADGATGTMLFGAGLQFGDPPETWNLAHPDVVRRIQRGYLAAGSRIVLTNTFGGNRLRLRLHGLQDRVDELNRTAAILLRAEVRSAGDRALVAGDIGPSGEIVAPLGTLEYDEAVDVFREQAASLVAGGVDLIWIETMSDLNEIKAAIQGVRQAAPGIALVTTMTFDTRGFTMMGVTPEDAVRHLAAWGADAIGGNCGNGPDELIPVIAKMRAVAPDVVLVAKSNAGMPELIDMQAVYRASPELMAETALEMRGAGARIVGACCGSTPDHLRAMAGALGTTAG